MARTRTTPIQIQVQKLYRQVAEGGEHISALTLEPRIERPRTQTRRTTLNYIHQALQRLWAAGEIAAYVDAGGGLIRESQVGEPGSLAVRHPQIFNLPGGPLPPGAEREITYAERQSLPHEGQAAEEPADGQLVLEAEPGAGAAEEVQGGPRLDKDTGTVFAHALSAPPPPEPAPDADEPTVEAHPEAPEEDLEEREPDEELELLRQMEMREVLARLPSDIAKCVAAAQQRMPTCPDWLPDDVLACWLVLPDVVKSLRAGQTKAANQAERSQMISTGIGRNGPVSPQALGKLVHLVRRQQFWWLRLLDFAVGDVFVTRTLHQSWIALEWDEGRNLPPEEVPPMALQLLAGLVGGYDDELLRGLVDDAEEEISEAKRSTVEQEITRLNEQVRDLKVEASESQEEVRTLKSELRAARARADNLRTSLEGLRASLEQQDSELGRKVLDLEERLAEAVSVTEGLREDRATAESTLEATREQMQAVEDDLANMRSMAARLESDKQNLQAELQQAYAGQADLRARLAEHTGVPQPENATELADTIGQLVAHLATGALERLRAGQADERDALILEIAAQVADFARRLRTLGPEPGRDELLAGPAVGEREAAPEEAPEAGADEVPEAAETDEAPMGVEDAGYVAREAPAAAEVPVPVTVAEPEPEPQPGAPAVLTSRRNREPWTLTALGGAQEVGASCIVATAPSGRSVLLDCGQRVRGVYGDDQIKNLYHFRVDQAQGLSAIVVSHAHIDHVGSLPTLHPFQCNAQNEDIPIFMSEPTAELARIMLLDAAKVQERQRQSARDLADSDWSDAFDDHVAYNAPTVETVMDAVEVLDPVCRHTIPGTEIDIELLPVPHVLGACAVVLREAGHSSLMYTGDLGPIAECQLTMPRFGDGVQHFPSVDLLIMEGTHGARQLGANQTARQHPDGGPRAQAMRRFCQVASEAIERGGSVLIPAFALGRTQEILRLLDQQMGDGLPKAPVYLGGMGERITRVYEDWRLRPGKWVEPGGFVTDALSLNNWLGAEERFEDAVARVLAHPGYIVASPGMLGSGWSQTFAEMMAPDPKHAIIHVGFVRERREVSPDRPFLARDGDRIVVQASTAKIPLSAHASREDLFHVAQHAAELNPQTAITLVHGDASALGDLATDLSERLSIGVERLPRGSAWRPRSSG